MRRPSRRTVGLLLAASLLAGCGVGADAKAPDWRPKPSFNAEGGPNAQLPTPGGPPPNGSQSAPSPGSGPPNPPTGTSGPDPAVVATGLGAPTGIAPMPDGTALVGERRTGRIVRVQPQPGQPVTAVRTLAGLDGSGDGGLLDLALSPTFAEDNLIYAYVTTSTDDRVVDFTLTGPVTPVLTGIPKGATANTGRLAFATDGSLYVGTGDIGNPALAASPISLAGKVLRVDAIGHPAAGNPVAGSAVFTRGHHVVDGLCLDPQSGVVFEAERGATASAPDEVNALVGGRDYGPPASGSGSSAPAATLAGDRSGVGGCAVLSRHLFVTSRDGRALMSAPLKTTTSGVGPEIGDFTDLINSKYGRLLTVVAALDGALWLTTSNKDGRGNPVADDDRVLRLVPSGGGAGSPPV
ncbi:MAG: PQQ-dependent sugar dehydrogenase [Actinomycetota bacterium]